MLPIESLVNSLEEKFPGSTKVDKPRDSNGLWYVDINLNQNKLIVEWSDRFDFGLSFINHTYGSTPDEVYNDVDSLLNRIVFLLEGQNFNRTNF